MQLLLGAVAFQGAQPVGAGHVDGTDAHAAALRVLYQGGRAVEAHRPAVEHGGEECLRVVHLEISTRVDEQRE